MKTDDFIAMLASDAEVIHPRFASRRFPVALGLGIAGAAVLMLLLLHVRTDLAQAVWMPLFWSKAGFVAAVAGISLMATLRLSRPGQAPVWPVRLLAIPVAAMWAAGAIVLWNAEAGERVALFLGSTWKVCPFLIAILSTPVFVGVIWAMRGLAPTRHRQAGFFAGLLSGATAALVYCVHCPEMQAPFIGFWYVLGMLIPAVIGTALGPRLLRW